MKRRRNPTSHDYPHPPDPYGIDDVGPVVLAIESDRDLYEAERATLVKLAKDAVAGKYTEARAIGAWQSLVRKGLREYNRFAEERLPKTAEWATTSWYTAWGEHQLFGRGMHHLLRLSQGDTSEV